MASRISMALGAVVVAATLTPVAAHRPAGSTPKPASSEPSAVPERAAAARYETRSFYIANPSPDAVRHRGCGQGDIRGRMTLFFGAPVAVGPAVGATLWGGADQATVQIGELMKEFVRGYAYCRQSPGHQLLVGMGTSTSRIDGRPDEWLVLHGRHWAQVVADVAAWADHHYPGVARVYGAWDPEPSWSQTGKAEAWMRGYDGHPGRRAVHVHASADGCPRDASNNGACNNGWRQHHLWRLAWQYDPALPMPQIYATSGVNARQWQKIDEYGAVHMRDGMVFTGVMAQASACLQVGGCAGTNITAGQAHDFLLWYLNTSPHTAQPEIENATDIQWHR
jgi:hypothetical protein